MNIKNRGPAGGKLRAWMTLHGRTVTEVAETLGVTRNTLYRWMKGEVPSPAKIVEIHDLTGIKPGDWYKP